VEALKAVKDSADMRWAEYIAEEVAGVMREPFAVYDGGTVVATTPARESAKAGLPHFGLMIAREVAGRLGLTYVDLFEVQPTDRRGHHPMRKRLAPVLKAVVEGWKVLLVNDVATSGFTMADCVRTLKQAGAAVMPIVWIFGDAEKELR
jgi:glutamine phosphoribosylpyrophosphate amidotransferase